VQGLINWAVSYGVTAVFTHDPLSKQYDLNVDSFWRFVKDAIFKQIIN
jgi:hypothetical protein